PRNTSFRKNHIPDVPYGIYLEIGPYTVLLHDIRQIHTYNRLRHHGKKGYRNLYRTQYRKPYRIRQCPREYSLPDRKQYRDLDPIRTNHTGHQRYGRRHCQWLGLYPQTGIWHQKGNVVVSRQQETALLS